MYTSATEQGHSTSVRPPCRPSAVTEPERGRKTSRGGSFASRFDLLDEEDLGKRVEPCSGDITGGSSLLYPPSPSSTRNEHLHRGSSRSPSPGMRSGGGGRGPWERRRSSSPVEGIRECSERDDGLERGYRAAERGRLRAWPAGVKRDGSGLSGRPPRRQQDESVCSISPAPLRRLPFGHQPPPHRRRATPPAPSPRPRSSTSVPSPRLYGYQLYLPSSQLVPLLIGPRGERSSAIRQQARLVELTLGYLPSNLAPVARLQGEYEAVQRGLDGIRECVLREGAARMCEGDLLWCAFDTREVWDMGFTKEEHLKLAARRQGGMVEGMQGLDRRHPFAQSMITRLPRGAQPFDSDGPCARSATSSAMKRRGSTLDRDDRSKVARGDGRRRDFNDLSRAASGIAPTRRMSPSPPAFSSAPPSRSHLHPPPPSRSSNNILPSPATSSASSFSILPRLPSPSPDEVEGVSTTPLDCTLDHRQALALLRRMPTNQRIELWGSDPLRSPFVSPEPSPMSQLSCGDSRASSVALEDRYTPQCKSEDQDMADSCVSPASERLGADLQSEMEDGEVVPDQLMRDKSAVGEVEGSEKVNAVPQHARADSVLSFLDYDC